MKIAFFDFDGTLTRHDSFIEFAKFSVGNKAFVVALLKSLPALCLWKLKIKTNSYAKQTLFSHLYRGFDYVNFKQLCYHFAGQIDKDLRDDTIKIKDEHKAKGHKVIIVSASIGDWIRPWAQNNGIDEIIATEVEIDKKGRLTGRFSTHNCHGEEKAVRIKQRFPAVNEIETWGYGDSAGDDAMLALVTHPNRV